MSSDRPPSHLPSLWFTAILAVLLGVPFAIKLLLTEPYPAVIMPSGSGRVDISDGCYTFTHYRAHGLLANGTREHIDLVELIQPAHQQYMYKVFNNHLGLNPDSRKHIQLRGTDWTVANYRQRGALEAQQAACRARLMATWEHRYTAILLEKVTVRGDIASRNWIEETLDESIHIEL